MHKFWLLSMLWVSITSVIFGWVHGADAKGEQDAQQIISVIQPYMSYEKHFTYKYVGYYSTCNGSEDRILQVGQQLSHAFGLPLGQDLNQEGNHSVYSVKTEIMPDATAALTVASPEAQSACYMVLRLDASQEVQLTDLLKWQEQAGGQFSKLGIGGEWNVMVQGYVPQQALVGLDDAATYLENVGHALNGEIVERYHDDHTISLSLASDKFHAYVNSGGQTVNVQMALHQDSTSGMWRLTVGTPVITSEY
ncbi:YwmB family TATA-box binding protein [Paenibacillus aestuarii]|uniref:YwmB family TATA-box binding protein n=1 Tax=Paenibacillus aestuarii TaxID=516965 RepID=A0ABW0KDQ6_9BACL|nr:YwmB family TATA-box binding protein [Paenibacillus aestuarii]